jgi:hypothetical protein
MAAIQWQKHNAPFHQAPGISGLEFLASSLDFGI